MSPYSDVQRCHPMASLTDDERHEINLHMKARDAVARAVALVHDHPEACDYETADICLEGLDAAGILLAVRP